MKNCRLCLGDTAEINIFDNRQTLVAKFLFYCKLEMYKNDGLPEYVCVICIEKLEEVVRFINQCEESDRILRSNLDVDYTGVKTEKLEIKEELPVEFKEESVELKLIDFELSDFDNSAKDDSHDIFDDERDSAAFDDDNNIMNRNGGKRRKKGKRDNNGLLCSLCGKHYTTNSYYQEHMRTHGKREVACDKCPKTFSSRKLLYLHKRVHISDRKYQCEHCEKSFKTQDYVKRHMEYTHRKSRPLHCNICDKVFYRPQNLKKHTLVHTQEQKFECDICNRTFNIVTQLTLHRRIHSGERPYACRFCDSKFTIPKSLLEHERLHTGEKPFQCPTCHKGFAQKGNMKSHFRYNHKGMDFKKAVMENLNRT